MKILSLLSACVAVVFCTLIAPAMPVAAFAQDVVTEAVQPESASGLFASLLTSNVALAVIAMIAVATVVCLFALVVRSDRSRGAIEPEEALYHDPWRIPDRC